MAREAVSYNRKPRFDEARVAIEEASRESTGRRKKSVVRTVSQKVEHVLRKHLQMTRDIPSLILC